MANKHCLISKHICLVQALVSHPIRQYPYQPTEFNVAAVLLYVYGSCRHILVEAFALKCIY